jgi:hypothetical protein
VGLSQQSALADGSQHDIRAVGAQHDGAASVGTMDSGADRFDGAAVGAATVSAPCGLVARTIAPCMPGATSWLNTTLDSLAAVLSSQTTPIGV